MHRYGLDVAWAASRFDLKLFVLMMHFLSRFHQWDSIIRRAILLGVGTLVSFAAHGQTFVQSNFDAMLYLSKNDIQRGINWHSLRGVPLSGTVGTPTGSDGRTPAGSTPTPNQYSSVFFVGGVTKGAAPSGLDESKSFAGNAENLNWPRARSGGAVALVLRSQVGSPYFGRPVSFLFGSVISPPSTDENGVALANVAPADYWFAEPYSTSQHSGAPYYWSPHAGVVFANQAGPIQITWKKVTPVVTQPSDFTANPTRYVLQSGLYFTLLNVSYIVSGSAVKPPRKMYWTEGPFRATGKAVSVPTARVSALKIVYNSLFPERVESEYIAPGQSMMVANPANRLQELRTLWFDHQLGQIYAYNREGRVFVELLGDPINGEVRRHLGFEIVDVYQQVPPADVSVELGERLTPYSGQDDPSLHPELVQQGGTQSFTYLHMTEGAERAVYYAVRETVNVNDVLVHWLETGEQGLRWPFIFTRYKQVWPNDVAKYSHYVRPLVSKESEARLTAVPLPTDNVPAIQYQDPIGGGRAKLTEKFEFYTFLDAAVPAHRTLLRFTGGDQVGFERVFSWLDVKLKSPAGFAGSVATNLTSWNPSSLVFDWTAAPSASPRVMSGTVSVGSRISAPGGELGAGGESYWAGYILQANGNSFNPNAYKDPFTDGFDAANRGAIIPVNAIPGQNNLDVWWFRRAATNAIRNELNGFKPIYWPAVIGRYTIEWPASPSEIILASNDGTGGLESLQATGQIYVQNNRSLPGYNPNEEHALMLGGQAYALRDDLNITSGENYSSHPFVLLEYTEADGRPALRPFKVLREKPEAGIVFDYVVVAGGDIAQSGASRPLQAPMPLPLLPAPVEGSGAGRRNYNTEPSANSGDLPVGWNPSTDSPGPRAHYASFTFRDRKDNFWVYRGLHAGLPPLAAGKYVSQSFIALPDATAVVNQPFAYHVHASRQSGSLVMTAPTTGLPAGLTINSLSITGIPTVPGAYSVSLVVTDVGDGTSVTKTLVLNVVATGSVVAQGDIAITSANPFAGANVTYIGRPPLLAETPTSANCFTMRFYYKTQEGFAWPGVANPPSVGSIVPYLRPREANGEPVGTASSKNTAALDIVYRPVWAGNPPKLRYGETLTVPKNGLPAVRGQSSAEIIYQQSIGLNLPESRASVILHDPTREKSYSLGASTLSKIPAGVRTDSYQGKLYFPNLAPHLAQRFFFDPSRGAKGALVFRGEFKDEIVGEKYLLLNVVRGSDLAALKGLCPTGDGDKTAWNTAIDGLTTTVKTFYENPSVPGQYIPNPALTKSVGASTLVEVGDDDTAVDSYALSVVGPGHGYATLVVGNGSAFTPPGEPVSVYVFKVVDELVTGELKVLPSENPLNELLTLQHSADLAGKFADFEYEWKIAPPVDGKPLDVAPVNSTMSGWNALVLGVDQPRHTLGGNGIQVLVDNYITLRYRPKSTSHPLYNVWSDWTPPQLAEGWIKRVLAGINPFNQRVTDLFGNSVNTDASILTQAGRRSEGDIALNLDTINSYGLIEIYETVLRRGKGLSIDSGINFGPANDALLLAVGYINDLYMMLGNEAWADAANPTIGIGTKDKTYGDVATALFSFKGQLPSLLEEELALLRGRDDFLQPGVVTTPVYNRLFWNYTRGIDAGEVIYALNYNIVENPGSGGNGVVDAADAAKLFPQGHGDAYGHYLTALKGYLQLLMDTDFDWVPRTEAVTILGKAVQVDYLDERKFAAAAAATARAAQQIFDLTWRKDYRPGQNVGWEHLATNRVNPSRQIINGAITENSVRHWGADHWASRGFQGAYFNWIVGNAILPAIDPDPSHEGIQKIDRTTVPELKELAAAAASLQTDLDNTEGRLTPLGLAEGSLAFDINPDAITGANSQTHFEQIFGRAKGALNNAVAAFDDAKDVTRLMRSEQDSLAELQAAVARQEFAYTNALIEIYGTPYPADIGPGKTYKQGYVGPDFLHYVYVDNVELTFPGLLEPENEIVFKIDIQTLPAEWRSGTNSAINLKKATDDEYSTNGVDFIEYQLSPHGFFSKPKSWLSRRQSPGRVQQAISDIIKARNHLFQALNGAEGAKAELDGALRLFDKGNDTTEKTDAIDLAKFRAEQSAKAIELANELLGIVTETAKKDIEKGQDVIKEALPTDLIAGLAAGGDLSSPARAAVKSAGWVTTKVLDVIDIARKTAVLLLRYGVDTAAAALDRQIATLKDEQATREAVYKLEQALGKVQEHFTTINQRLQEYDDAQRKYRTVLAEADRIQLERESFRQRAAAVIQGFRTRDAAFRIFRNEKLERYKSLFDLAARFGYLAATAFDYETGLLGTRSGGEFVNRIISSRALGLVKNGEPQYAGSNTGDPGLSSALAEMKADWDVLRGRLGFNNPEANGTTLSLRSESFRILPGTEGDASWQDILNVARKSNLLDDADVRRYCMQVDPGDGLPVPGLILEFTTTIASGYNLFGQMLAAGDHDFSPSKFATKIFALGVALEGYKGMDDPTANSGAITFAGGTSPGNPSVTFLDSKALAATPDIYLIPVGVDSMRSPPLGDVSHIRSWLVDDVTIPLPFNIGSSDFSTKQLYQSSESLTEPLFNIRKHPAFRPVSTTAAFSGNIYGLGGSLQRSQYTNTRLIGRSVWNSKWKLVIPGHELLNNPNEGLDRFILSVKDVKLHFVTYSYSGN